MTFLNPLVLLGLAAAAIPLIVHLFNFRRPRRVDFSSLAFLKELEKTTMQRVRVKQLLLLLLRTLAIACLVLAFARPTLTGGLASTVGGRAATSAVVVIDNSLSMTLRDAQGSYLAQAKGLAADVVRRLEDGDEIFVLTTAPSTATGRTSFAHLAPALDVIEGIEAAPGARSAAATLAAARAMLEDAVHLSREIYYISDLQRSTLLDAGLSPADEDVPVVLLPVGRRGQNNVAVTDVRIVSRIIEQGSPVRLEATLVNFGQDALQDYVASVYIDGERVAQAPADLPPGVAVDVSFTVTPRQRGWLPGLVQIEDDLFAHDNERHFTLHVPDRRRVLLVQGQGQTTNYVSLALSPELSDGRVAFDVVEIRENQLAAVQLGEYDAVVLVGPQTLSSGEVAGLERFVEGGGGLMFFPAARGAAEDYNSLFGSLGGGTFSGFSGALGGDRPVAAFDRVDLEHPLFEGIFDRPLDDEAGVENPDVLHAMNYTPESATEQTLIGLTNGFPFLQEVRHGRGVAFLFSVAPDARWSDLPVRGLFVPLLYRSVFYLAADQAAAGDQLLVGREGELRVSGGGSDEQLRLVAPNGEEFTPQQRTLFGATLLQISGEAIYAPGIYHIRSGEERVRSVAINLNREESDPTVAEPAEAGNLLAEEIGGSVQAIEARESSAGVVAAMEPDRSGLELWNVFLMLALVFLAAEMVVERQWRPETVTA